MALNAPVLRRFAAIWTPAFAQVTTLNRSAWSPWLGAWRLRSAALA
jgi:hypothetical protein